NPEFSSSFNFYNVHYAATHVVVTSGGNTDDMLESLKMMEAGKLNPSTMITHVGGLDAVIETTLNLPNIPGGKKLVYNNVSMPLVALDDLKGMDGDLYQGLADLVEKHNGLWSPEAEQYLLANAPSI
ncbi:MAG: L-sorbose 1-phosphate reductase, partial [Verrucomicrobia bacterium]